MKTLLNPVERILIAPLRKLDNSKMMNNLADKASRLKNYDKILAYTTISSIALKDGIGCYMYVNQSLHNEKIPKEKRGFVAALDLTNGGLMIGAQILFFILFKRMKIADRLFNKLYGKTFSPANIKAATTNIKARKANAHFTKCPDINEKINKEFMNKQSENRKLFASLLDLAAATILAKRVVVPFIATPLAGWAKDHFIEKNTDKTSNNELEKNAETKEDKMVIQKEAQPNCSNPDCPHETQKNEPEFKGNILEHYKATHH